MPSFPGGMGDTFHASRRGPPGEVFHRSYSDTRRIAAAWQYLSPRKMTLAQFMRHTLSQIPGGQLTYRYTLVNFRSPGFIEVTTTRDHSGGPLGQLYRKFPPLGLFRHFFPTVGAFYTSLKAASKSQEFSLVLSIRPKRHAFWPRIRRPFTRRPATFCSSVRARYWHNRSTLKNFS